MFGAKDLGFGIHCDSGVGERNSESGTPAILEYGDSGISIRTVPGDYRIAFPVVERFVDFKIRIGGGLGVG